MRNAQEKVHKMRFLYFTDTHIRGTNPQNRLDSFPETLHKKINEVIDIAKYYKADVLLHGGDIFDRPDISPSLVRQFVLLLKKSPFPIYVVAGNHDIYGQNPLTINRTMLGLLDSTGVINIIKQDEMKFFEDGNIKIQLTGRSYSYGIDTDDGFKSYIVKKDQKANYAVHMVHGMLLAKPFFKDMAYTLIDDIIETQADITLCGHYHTGFGVKKLNGKYFVNPGGLVRINNSINELLRMPKVVLFEIKESGINIEEITLKTALPGHEVLDRSKLEAMSFKEKKLAEFVQSVYTTGEYNTVDISTIIDKISQEDNLKPEVIEEALNRIGFIEEVLSSTGDNFVEVS